MRAALQREVGGNPRNGFGASREIALDDVNAGGTVEIIRASLA
jgi:hypothetical protein